MRLATNVATGLATLAVTLGGGVGIAAASTQGSATPQPPVATHLQHKRKTAKKEATEKAPTCGKHLTVVFSVAAGSTQIASLSNGCWKVVDADPGANKQFRDCSGANGAITNPNAPNFAFDDTNPLYRTLDESTMPRCVHHATGTGFEYMANRDGWLLLPNHHVKAYFAELYSVDGTVANLLGDWKKSISHHRVSPMINIAPDQPHTIQSAALDMCKQVPNNSYFGEYDGDWRAPMSATDPRAKALATALNECTKAPPHVKKHHAAKGHHEPR